jgi:acetate---CoA ligase (ADP-forming)
MSEPLATDLGLFFHPRSIAVVGASDREGSPNRTYWNLIRAWGGRQRAEVFPVNPNRDTIDDVPCFADLTSLPVVPNVVAILTGDPIPSLREAVALGVDFVVVFASGYAEAGADGARRQRELKDVLAGSLTRLIGPNTNLNTFEKFRDDLTGKKVALITQSGHQGRPIYLLQELGVPVSYGLPPGTKPTSVRPIFCRGSSTNPTWERSLSISRRSRMVQPSCARLSTPVRTTFHFWW